MLLKNALRKRHWLTRSLVLFEISAHRLLLKPLESDLALLCGMSAERFVMLLEETTCDVFTVKIYDDHGIFRTVSDRDNHTSVRFWSHTNTDGEIGVIGLDIGTRHSNVYHQKNSGQVVVYPSHPRYASYPFPEVEVEPSPNDKDLILGKVIASWDIAETF